MPAQRDPLLRRSGQGNICIKGLTKTTTARQVFEICTDIGAVLSVKVPTLADGTNSGFAFVQFESEEVAQAAMPFFTGADSLSIDGSKVSAEKYVRKEQRAAAKANSWTNLLVKNVPADWTTEDLQALFSKHGEITSAVVVKTSPDGSRPSMGYVNFATNAEAEAALKAMDGQEVTPKTAPPAQPAQPEGEAAADAPVAAPAAPAPLKLAVMRHMKKSERLREARSKWMAAKGISNDPSKSSNLYVKNLPETMDDEGLRNTFKPFGTITSAKVMRDSATNVSRGFGFVSFASREEAEAARSELHKKPMSDGRPLYVSWFETKTTREAHAAEEKRRAAAAAATAAQQRGGFAAAGAGAAGMGGLGNAGMNLASLYANMYGMNAGLGGQNAQQQLMMMLAQQGNPQLQQMLLQQQLALAQQQQQQGGAAGQGARPAAMGAPAAGGQPRGPVQGGAPMQQQGAQPRAPNAAPAGTAPMGMQQARPAVGMQQGMQQGGQAGARPGMVASAPMGMAQGMGARPAAAAQGGYAAAAGAAGPRPGMGMPQAGPRSFAAAAAPRPGGVVLNSNAVVPQGMQQAAPARGGIIPAGFVEALAKASKPEQRNMLGEKLYPLIAEREPQLAGKITGMLLELDTQEVLGLLEDPPAVAAKVDEARAVLETVRYGGKAPAPGQQAPRA